MLIMVTGLFNLVKKLYRNRVLSKKRGNQRRTRTVEASVLRLAEPPLCDCIKHGIEVEFDAMIPVGSHHVSLGRVEVAVVADQAHRTTRLDAQRG